MRQIVCYLILASVCTWVGCAIRIANTSPRDAATLANSDDPRPSGWRRTAQGWERAERWRIAPDPSSFKPTTQPIHPLNFALIELFVCLAALAAFPVRATNRTSTGTTDSGAEQ